MITLAPAMPGPHAMSPRPYQAEAIEALHNHICTREDNPCIVIPTAGGKSPIMAWMIQKWTSQYPGLRVISLAHVKELVQQNAEKMLAIWPDADVGIYAAGLKARDRSNAITFASIDSVYSKAADFAPFDVAIVDEAHRIPAKGEGKYRRFIAEATLQNPRLRVCGFTATPFRMVGGPICHRDHVLNTIAYEAKIRDLIDNGFLCPLRSKVSATGQPDLSNVHQRGGEYIGGELAKAVNIPALVTQAVTEALRILDAEGRRHAIWFCVSVDHAKQVAAEIERLDRRPCPVITGTTPQRNRDATVDRFKAGQLRHLANVNVFTEGFDAPLVDAVVMLRPTQSKGLYTQMVGRGLRLDPDKADCLILDFAHCIEAHGPLDLLEAGEVTYHLCAKCAEVFSKAVGACPACGEPVPKATIEAAAAAAERQRAMHDAKAGQASIISGGVSTAMTVDAVTIARHTKPGKPDSIRISYRCGLRTFYEWITPDHGFHARQRASDWWRARFPGESMPSVDGMISDLLLPSWVKGVTREIFIRHEAGRENITGYTLDPHPQAKTESRA